MALQGPVGKENLEISFRLQSKTQLFDGSNNALLGGRFSIVASASNVGLVFAASSTPEIIVVCLKDLETHRDVNQAPPLRRIPLQAPASHIATNCDSSILAVALKLNGAPHIQLYSVASFLTPNPQKIREFRISADNADASQLCWNPVMNATLAVCTESGGLVLYTVKEAGMEFHSIDANLKAKCCCWSPKGKQIVVGFGNGRLMQFTPEMKAAKAIECPPGIFPGSFDTVAIQWLSTFQFAVAFLSHQPESRPVLHIINAPKGAVPQYIAYNEVCFSPAESRPSKIYLQHIMQWNMLLVSSANSIDVCFLRVTQAGDLPIWTQEFPNDLYPGELPLTPSNDESFPVGFDIETGCSNRLPQEDGSPYPVMPMVHIVSTFGVLCSFYILNTMPTYIDICSPPRPLDPAAMSLFKVQQAVTFAAPQSQQQPDILRTPPKAEMLFTPPVQSTPAIPKVQPMPIKPPPSNLFSGSLLGNTSQPPPAFGANTPFQVTPSTPFQVTPKTTPPPVAATFGLNPTSTASAQPLITVPQTYTPPVATQGSSSINKPASERQYTAEDEQLYSRMIVDEMKAFELELKTVMEKSRSLRVNIGTKEESSVMRKSIEELDELKKEATETIDSLRSDVQSNRLGMTEMFSMVFEARAKFDQATKEKSVFMNQNQVQDRAGKRSLDRLVKQVSQCEMQMQLAIQALNSQWASYQEAMNKNKKNRMHNPSLEGLYQTLNKQQQIIYRQNEKMGHLKAKLGLRDHFLKQKSTTSNVNNVESLSDSMISVSLADQVESENAKLTNKKLKNLRNLLDNREVVTIKPQRPDRAGLNSEIIREKKMQMMKTMRKIQSDVTAGIFNPTLQPPQRVQVQQKPPAQQTSSIGSAPGFGFGAPAFIQASVPQHAPSMGLNTSSSAPTFGVNPQMPFGISLGSTAASTQSQQLSFSQLKKPDEPVKVPLSGFGTAANPQGLSFGMNSSSGKPSFGLSSAPLFPSAEKKREEAAGQPARLYINPVAHKPTAEGTKTPSTISNTNVAVSATFSIPLANKVSPKEPARVVEKNQDENKPPSTTENTTFTFKLGDKKDESPTVNIKAPPSTPNFSSLLSGAGDGGKGFSFATGVASNPFDSASSTADAKTSKAPTVATTTAPIFGGFGSNPASSSFPGFGSGFSLGLGDSAKEPSSGFSLNLTSSDDTKTAPTPNFSFASLASSATETKPQDSTTTTSSISKPQSSSTFSFSSSLAQALTSAKKTESTEASSTSSSFSFDSSGVSVSTAPNPTPVDLSKATVTTTAAQSAASTVSSIESTLDDLNVCSPEVKPVPQNAPSNIFASSAIPASAAKTETSPIFASNAFASALSSNTSTFGSQSPPAQEASPTSTSSSIFGSQQTTITAAPSLFGSLSLSASDASKTSTTSPPSGLFSSLIKPDQSVFSSAASASPGAPVSASPFGGGVFNSPGTQASNIFGAQNTSVSSSSNTFGAAAVPSSPGSIFGSAQAANTQSGGFGGTQSSIFGQSPGATAATGGSLFSQSSFASTPSSNIFGGSQVPAASAFGGGIFNNSGTQGSNVFGAQNTSVSSSSNIFGAAATPSSPGSIFGSAPAASAQPGGFGGAQSSIFGQSQGSTAATGGSLFSQSSFASPSSNIFGGSQAPAAASPFGGSTFGQSATFGGQATFGSPKANIFGGQQQQQAAPTGQSNSLFEQLGSQGSGNMFGNLAQNTQPTQQPPQQGGFSGSAFSSWR